MAAKVQIQSQTPVLAARTYSLLAEACIDRGNYSLAADMHVAAARVLREIPISVQVTSLGEDVT